MMKSIGNKGITATIALKNEVAGETKPLFGLAKTSHTAGTLCAILPLTFFEKYGIIKLLERRNLWQ
jgi:hypothetical protein